MRRPDQAYVYVSARIDRDTKNRAAEVLKGMGLTISDAIRMLLQRIVEEQRLPFEIRPERGAATWPEGYFESWKPAGADFQLPERLRGNDKD